MSFSFIFDAAVSLDLFYLAIVYGKSDHGRTLADYNVLISYDLCPRDGPLKTFEGLSWFHGGGRKLGRPSSKQKQARSQAEIRQREFMAKSTISKRKFIDICFLQEEKK